MLSTATWIAAARNASYRGAILVVSKPAPAALACACLDAGADDYVRRPLEAIELRSRITALLRRCRPPPVTRATDPALLLDENALALRLGTWSARLRKTSFDLLAYLVERSARWVRSDELRIHVLHTHCAPGASNVRWHVSQARQALGEMSWWLHSDTQRGYMFARQMCDAPHCRRGARRHA